MYEYKTLYTFIHIHVDIMCREIMKINEVSFAFHRLQLERVMNIYLKSKIDIFRCYS